MKIEKQPKMKASVLVGPRKLKEIIILILMLLVIFSVIVPFVNVINIPVLVLGMPLLMFWSIGVIIAVTVILFLAYKWEVH